MTTQLNVTNEIMEYLEANSPDGLEHYGRSHVKSIAQDFVLNMDEAQKTFSLEALAGEVLEILDEVANYEHEEY